VGCCARSGSPRVSRPSATSCSSTAASRSCFPRSTWRHRRPGGAPRRSASTPGTTSSTSPPPWRSGGSGLGAGADQEPEWAPLRLSPMCAIVRRHRRPSNRSRCGSRCAGVRPRRTGRPSRPCGPSGTRTSDRTARSIPRCSSLPEVVRHRAEGPGSRDRRRCTVPRRRRLMPRHHDGRPTPRSVGTVAGTRPGCVAIRTSNDD
jgi:hypothetical protein